MGLEVGEIFVAVEEESRAAEGLIDDLSAVEDQQLVGRLFVETAVSVELGYLDLLQDELMGFVDDMRGPVARLDLQQDHRVQDAVDLAEGGHVLDHVHLGIPAQLVLVMHAQRGSELIHPVTAGLDGQREQGARADVLVDALVNQMLPLGQDLVAAVVAQQLQGGEISGKCHEHSVWSFSL